MISHEEMDQPPKSSALCRELQSDCKVQEPEQLFISSFLKRAAGGASRPGTSYFLVSSEHLLGFSPQMCCMSSSATQKKDSSFPSFFVFLAKCTHCIIYKKDKKGKKTRTLFALTHPVSSPDPAPVCRFSKYSHF